MHTMPSPGPVPSILHILMWKLPPEPWEVHMDDTEALRVRCSCLELGGSMAGT